MALDINNYKKGKTPAIGNTWDLGSKKWYKWLGEFITDIKQYVVKTEFIEIGEIDYNDMNDWVDGNATTIIFKDVRSIIGIKQVVNFYAKTTEEFTQDYPYQDQFGIKAIGFYASNMNFASENRSINDMTPKFDDTIKKGGFTVSFTHTIGFPDSLNNQMLNTTIKDVIVSLQMVTGTQDPNPTNNGGWLTGKIKIYAEVKDIPVIP